MYGRAGLPLLRKRILLAAATVAGSADRPESRQRARASAHHQGLATATKQMRVMLVPAATSNMSQET
jgi:hypothetical protein